MKPLLAVLFVGTSLAVPGRAIAADEHIPFRVMTYNVRHATAEDVGVYDWGARSPNVIQLIENNDPDLFGTQESSSQVIQDDLVAAFDATYDRYHPSNGSPKIIFFRRGRFERAQGENVEGIIGFDNPYADGETCYSNASGRTASWVKLRDLQSGRQYFVVNAHVAHAAACNLARELSADRLRELIEAESGGLPAIVMGDFNTDPQREGVNDDTVTRMEAERSGLRLYRSARHNDYTNASSATFNGAWKQASTYYARLDYIFIGGHDVTTYHPSVDRTELGGISPSDHFAVLATVRQGFFGDVPLVDTQGEGAAEGTELAFADVNGDLAADKISVNPGVAGGVVRTYLSDGFGAFGAPHTSASGSHAVAGSKFWFADLDGDGCADEISWNPEQNDGQVQVALAICDGGFGEASAVLSGASDDPSMRYYYAAIDGDACSDRIVWNPAANSGKTAVSLSRCDGTFGAALDNEDDGRSTNAAAWMYFADVTGDGLADKLVWDVEVEGGRTRVYASNGDGSFSHLSTHTGGYSGVEATRYHFGDIDADGHADKVFWRHSFRQGHPQIYRGTADGFEPHPSMGNPGATDSSSNRYFLADIDGNGSTDLVAWDPTVDGGATHAYLAFAKRPPAPDDPPASDAGMDAGADAPPDGQVPSDDAGSIDAGPSNAGAPGGDSSGGCGCAVRATRHDGLLAALAALLIVSLRKKRRSA